MMRRAGSTLLCALVAGCAQPAESPVAPLQAPPVDTQRIRIEDAAQWPHRRTIHVDLDGDGTVERVVLAADVTLNDAGAALWEDGHRWALFVEDAGERTLVYGAFVPNGHAEVGLLAAEGAERARHLLVRERTPQQVRTVVVEYRGPGAARTISDAHYQIDQWLPPLTGP